MALGALHLLAFAVVEPVWADQVDQPTEATKAEPYNSGWSFQFDNDAFANGSRDRDYSGGFVVTWSGQRAQEYRWSPEKLRAWTASKLGLLAFFKGEEHVGVHALEWGGALFTPDDIEISDVIPDDRPYASLFFLSSTEQNIYPDRNLSVKSGLTVGFIGLDIAETIQSGVHSIFGQRRPEGWDNQISSGGELTAKYSINVQKSAYRREYSNGLAQQINLTGKVDVGFITGAGMGVNWRYGRLYTPWWSFNPQQSDYLSLGANVAPGLGWREGVKERYVYAGAAVNANAYNALVQGQFRDSANEVSRADINTASVEVWVGVSGDVGDNLRADFFVRGRTRDLEIPDAKNLLWGGIVFSKTF